MRRPFQKLSIVAVLVLFAFSLGSDVFSKGFRSSGRSYGSRSYSSSRSYTRSTRSSTSSSRTYGSSAVRSSSRTARASTSRSYGSSAASSSRPSAARTSSAVRQRQTARSSAKTGSAVSTRNMTSSQKRSLRGQQRQQTRNLKAENRSLKRQVRTANRDTARARRQAREAQSPITVNNFGMYYPMGGYSIYSLTASMMFANMVSGIYFHDYYNHRLRHSWMWYYHHPNYDRSHWSQERQMEYEKWRAYYDSQGIKPDSRYVDPGTNRDEDYIESHVNDNTDKFYGTNAEEAVTVEELPDEEALRNIVLAGDSQTSSTSGVQTQSQAQTQPQKIVVQKKTSGGTWFVLVFGSLLIIGVVVLIMYNKGYF